MISSDCSPATDCRPILTAPVFHLRLSRCHGIQPESKPIPGIWLASRSNHFLSRFIKGTASGYLLVFSPLPIREDSTARGLRNVTLSKPATGKFAPDALPQAASFGWVSLDSPILLVMLPKSMTWQWMQQSQYASRFCLPYRCTTWMLFTDRVYFHLKRETVSFSTNGSDQFCSYCFAIFNWLT